MKLSAFAFVLGAALTAACSGSDPVAGSRSGSGSGPSSITVNETWSTGKRLSGAITIEAGVTVTIAPGATIAATPGTFVTVKGALEGESGATHATLSGDAWGGLIVVPGGALTLTGVDLENAAGAIDVQGGTATYKGGTIAWAATPFRVLEGAELTVSGSTISSASGLARIKGKLTFRDSAYDTLADHGILVDSPKAVVTIEDSKLQGHGAPTDVVSANAGSLTIAHADISNAHCGLHISNVDALDVSYVNVHDVAFGAMLYGSSTGGKLSITNSNFENADEFGVHEADGVSNGAIQIRGCYMAGNAEDSYLQPGSRIVVTDRATSRVAGAGPR